MKVLLLPIRAIAVAILFVSLAHAAPKKINWEDLAPSGNSGKSVDFSKAGDLKGMPKLSDFDDSKEDMKMYVDMMKFMKTLQPEEGNQIATSLNGQEVKIAGYVTPLTFEGEDVVDFLFVPYHGACVHVPPPPANQIVYVSKAQGMKADALYEPVWITGKLRASPVSTIVANTGYWIESAKVEPYTE